MRVTLTSSTAPELGPLIYVGRTDRIALDQLPVRISGLSVDLDIRPGDFVEVVDQETGGSHYGMVEKEGYPYLHWIVKTLTGERFLCATPRVQIRVRLDGRRRQVCGGGDPIPDTAYLFMQPPPPPHPWSKPPIELEVDPTALRGERLASDPNAPQGALSSEDSHGRR